MSEGLAPRYIYIRRFRLQCIPFTIRHLYCTREALRPGAPAMALHINGPIPISLYFCFLGRMVIGLTEDLPGVGMPRCSARSVWAPGN
jgi:hypothetical protein